MKTLNCEKNLEPWKNLVLYWAANFQLILCAYMLIFIFGQKTHMKSFWMNTWLHTPSSGMYWLLIAPRRACNQIITTTNNGRLLISQGSRRTIGSVAKHLRLCTISILTWHINQLHVIISLVRKPSCYQQNSQVI